MKFPGKRNTKKNKFSPAGIMLSSCARVIRNIEGEKFPGWATPPERRKLMRRVVNAVFRIDPNTECTTSLLDELDEKLYQQTLWIFNGRVSVNLNNTDHIHIEAFAPEGNLQEAWKWANKADERIDELLPYAWSPKFGYLSAHPADIGTGLQASTAFCLVGLGLLDELPGVINALQRLGYKATPMQILDAPTGTDSGYVYLVDNTICTGKTEEQILGDMERVFADLAAAEFNARARLKKIDPELLLDYIGRALGTAKHGVLFSLSEATKLLYVLKAGASMDLLPGITVERFDEMIREIQTLGAGTEYETSDEEEQSRYRGFYLSIHLDKVALIRR